MTNYYAINGQSLADICMNTYGTMDYFYKLLTDNDYPNADILPSTGTLFVWDETLVINSQISRTTQINNVRYATAVSDLNSTYYIVYGQSGAQIPAYTPPTNIPPIVGNYYERVSATNYISATDMGETVIVIPELVGKTVIQIEKNIQPLLNSEWSFVTGTGTITLTDAIATEEKLFIIYREIIVIS